MKEKHYIQVGVTALRTPTGKHYPAIPLYIEVDRLNESGLAPCEEKRLHDLRGLLSRNTARDFKRKKEQSKMTVLRYRTEYNYGSKYFTNIAAAFRYFYKCIAERKSVELWAITTAAMQELIDCVYFH